MNGITVQVGGNIQAAINAVARIPEEARKLQRQLPRELGKIIGDIAADEASKVYWIKKSRVKKAVSKTNAGIIIRGTRQNVIDFRMTPNRPGKRRKNGIRVAVMRSGGLKTIRSGFPISPRFHGRVLGMMRVGKGRYDLKALTAPAIPQLLNNEEVQAGIETRIQSEAIDALNLWLSRKTAG